MKATALFLSDGTNHRVMYLDYDVKVVAGERRIEALITHKTIKGEASRENAEANLSSLKGLPYTATGVLPVKDTIAVIGAWGADPVLPTGKSK